MHRRTVQREIAALAIVMTLALVGARPAAAAEPGFLDRLSNLWSAVTAEAPASLWDTLIGWFGGGEKSDSSTNPQDPADRGAGIDPNGISLTTEPTAPAAPNGSN